MAVLHVYSSRTDYDSPKDRSFQMDHPLMFKYHDQHISPRIWHKCVMLQIIMTHLTSYGNVCIDKNVYLIAFVLYHLTLKTYQTPNTHSLILFHISTEPLLGLLLICHILTVCSAALLWNCSPHSFWLLIWWRGREIPPSWQA